MSLTTIGDPDNAMERKILSNLSVAELNKILDSWNLHTSGSKADKIIRIEAATAEKYPDQTPHTFDFSSILQLSEPATDDNNSENVRQLMDQFQSMLSQFQQNSYASSTNTTAPSVNRQMEDQAELQSAKHLSLCSFWKNDPELWFITAEQKFRSHGIVSDDIKFGKLVDILDSSIISQIANILKNSSLPNKYDAVKKQLISIYKTSEENKIQKILNDTFLGDKKPSLLYIEMKDLACNNISDDFLLSMWMKKLPPQVEQNLRGLRAISTPEQILVIADGMVECSGNRIDAIKNSSEDSLMKEVSAKLDKVIDLLQCKFQVRKQNTASSDQKVELSDKICYYHRRFKDKATKCILPCAFSSSSENAIANH